MSLTVTPHDANITSPDISTTGSNRVRKITENAQTQLNAGLIRVNFERKGYISEEREYEIMRNSQTVDTVKMRRISYVKKNQFYFGAADPYTNLASYGFSSVRFRNRGYNSETQDVYLGGVRLNDAITGYSPYSLWSGLNEATRSKENVIGNETADYGVGGVNGQTNILATPSSVRPGWRFSVLSNSALYRLRLMATYASGELDNGWSYAFNVSARLGGNDWVEGVYYRNFAYVLP